MQDYFIGDLHAVHDQIELRKLLFSFQMMKVGWQENLSG